MGDNDCVKIMCDSNSNIITNGSKTPVRHDNLHDSVKNGPSEKTLKRVTAHPLQQQGELSPFLDTGSSGSSVTHSMTSSSINTASLIQAAARSMLDDSPGDFLSDDEDERSHRMDIDAQNGTDGRCSLGSLRKEILPIIPDEQDRKRFIGCLAAVLASRYPYDVDNDSSAENEDDSERTFMLDVNEQDSFNDGDCSDETDYNKNNSHSSSAHGRLEYSDEVCQPAYINCGAGFIQDAFNESDRYIRQKQKLRSKNLNGSKRFHIATSRHRKRRYDVLSRTLIQSAELMQLDVNQAKCFLPMLTGLLTPAKRPRPQSPLDQKSTKILRENERKQSFPRIVNHRPKDFCKSEEEGNLYLRCQIGDIEHLRPFLDSLAPGAGLRCLTMFLVQHLLHSEEGYDSRVRHAVKTLGVLLIMHDMEQDPDGNSPFLYTSSSGMGKLNHCSVAPSESDLCTCATRCFESLESTIASKLIQLSKEQAESHQRNNTTSGDNRSVSNLLSRRPRAFTSENVLRGLKIGAAGVAAGALFAVTGGIAAPGILAGVATIAGGTAITATAAAILTSTVAISTIFGVGGGSLAAYKMQRRTIGLTEFEFVKEGEKQKRFRTTNLHSIYSTPESELFSTVCISGWLRDNCDFQRPWGVTPTRPRIKDRLELLERFYAVYSPDHIPKSAKILASWKGQEKKLWTVLRKKYGCDPSNMLPLDIGPRYSNALNHEQREIVDKLFVKLGYAIAEPEERSQPTPFERLLISKMKSLDHPAGNQSSSKVNRSYPHNNDNRFLLNDSLHGPLGGEVAFTGSVESTNRSLSAAEKVVVENDNVPKHLATLWDYHATYGGELYTVRWESDLLTELCDSVADLAFDVVQGGTTHLLKFTALSTLISAMALPYALIHAANMIDATWTLGVERADEAGKELARSLLFSTAGNRPVTLVGFSFGARAVYSCLKELARFQNKWEDFREKRGDSLQINYHRRVGEFSEDSDEFYLNMREPASIVEDVVLMGLPNHLSVSSWKACRQIVSGRLVHCFSQSDLILSLMFQIKKFGLKPVCGTCPVNVAGVENFDVTDLISGHQDYCLNAGAILKRVRHCEPFPSSGSCFNHSGCEADDVGKDVTRLRQSK